MICHERSQRETYERQDLSAVTINKISAFTTFEHSLPNLDIQYQLITTHAGSGFPLDASSVKKMLCRGLFHSKRVARP
jgi:hypothetical protein